VRGGEKSNRWPGRSLFPLIALPATRLRQAPERFSFCAIVCRVLQNEAEYLERIEQVFAALEIPSDYSWRRGLKPYPEATDLVVVDEGDPPKRLAPEAAHRWDQLKRAAARDGVGLVLVSGFRSVDRQQALIENKLKRGYQLETILKILAAPGYSQHHTGLALDIGTGTNIDVTEAFEHTDAFAWLSSHAGEYGFMMPYPRGNQYGFVYEPWHWALETI
jgi:D-alanyl-D-alanine carboxypeptidase